MWENFEKINGVADSSACQTRGRGKKHEQVWFSQNLPIGKSLFLINKILMLWQFRVLKSLYDLNDPIREMVIFTIPSAFWIVYGSVIWKHENRVFRSDIGVIFSSILVKSSASGSINRTFFLKINCVCGFLNFYIFDDFWIVPRSVKWKTSELWSKTDKSRI